MIKYALPTSLKVGALLLSTTLCTSQPSAQTPAQCFQNPSLCQSSKPSKNTVAKAPDVIGEEFKKFNSEGRMQIQKTLADKGFYKSSIDGQYGPGTKNSIKLYLTNSGVDHSSRNQVSAALSKLVVFKEEVEKFISKKGKEEDTAKQLDAQNFISDLEEYISAGQSKFDLNFALEFAKISGIKKGEWSAALEETLTQFKLYVSNEQGFVNFHKIKSAERQKEYEVKLANSKESLFEQISLTRTWAKSNLLDERTAEVIKLVIAAEEAIQNSNLSIVEETLQTVTKMNSNLGVSKPASTDANRDSRFTPDSLYVFGNFTGKATHIFKGMTGQPEVTDGQVDICIVGEWDKWQRYTLLDYVSDKLNPDLYTISEQVCSGNEDLLAITGKDLIEGKLPISFETGYEDLTTITRSDSVAIKRKFSLMSEIYEDDVLNGVKAGYGVLSFYINTNSICLSVPEQSTDHMDALQGNFDLITLFDGILENVEFSENVLDAFRKVQRGKCGFVYAKSEDLAKLIDAAKNNKIDYSLLPVWVTEETLTKIAENRTATAKQRLSEQEARKQREQLTEQAREEAMKKALAKQAVLREKYEVRYSAILDQLLTLSNVAINFGFQHSPLDSNYINKYLELSIIDPITENSSSFDPLIEDMQNLALEKWEKTGVILEKIDYGSVNYKGRVLEGVTAEIRISLKNRVIGDFKTYCKKIRAIQDDDFDMWRNVELINCASDDQDWNVLNNFESRWVVKTDE